jgi:hypothetical protein
MAPTVSVAASGGITASARHHSSFVLHVVAGSRIMDTAFNMLQLVKFENKKVKRVESSGMLHCIS